MGTLSYSNECELCLCEASRPYTVSVDADADHMLIIIGGVCVQGGSQEGGVRLYTSCIMHACMNARLLACMLGVERVFDIGVVLSYSLAHKPPHMLRGLSG
jgi:hypothetical protein